MDFTWGTQKLRLYIASQERSAKLTLLSLFAPSKLRFSPTKMIICACANNKIPSTMFFAGAASLSAIVSECLRRRFDSFVSECGWPWKLMGFPTEDGAQMISHLVAAYFLKHCENKRRDATDCH